MSEPRCKVGQMAFVKKAIRKENVGKTVTCIRYLGYHSQGDVIEISGERFLAIDTDHYWLIRAHSLETQYGSAIEAYTVDSWLQPIEPLNDEDLVEDKELEEV